MSRIIRMIVSKIMFDMFEKQLCFPRNMLMSLQLDLFWHLCQEGKFLLNSFLCDKYHSYLKLRKNRLFIVCFE